MDVLRPAKAIILGIALSCCSSEKSTDITVNNEPVNTNIDKPDPIEGYFTVNNHAAVTSSMDVTLSFESDEGEEVYVTNTEGCAADGQWRPPDLATSWTLAGTEGINYVFAVFRNENRFESECLETSIELDTQAPGNPEFSSINPSGTVNTVEVRILGTASADTVEVNLYSDADCATSYGGATPAQFAEGMSIVLTSSNGVNKVYATSRDAAGNSSACTHLTDITHQSED